MSERRDSRAERADIDDPGIVNPRPYPDRAAAGRRLAVDLASYAGRADVSVLALPRGGVPVGCEVARALSAPLDVFVVRKLGVPGHEELAMGAIASGGVLVLNRRVVDEVGIAPEEIEAVVAAEQAELTRRQRLYRGEAPEPGLRGRAIMLVDDGLATGSTMRAAVAALRQRGPARIVVAVPVAARATVEALCAEVDEVVCTLIPEPFYAVGSWYEEFGQTTDREVRRLLELVRASAGRASGAEQS